MTKSDVETPLKDNSLTENMIIPIPK